MIRRILFISIPEARRAIRDMMDVSYDTIVIEPMDSYEVGEIRASLMYYAKKRWNKQYSIHVEGESPKRRLTITHIVKEK